MTRSAIAFMLVGAAAVAHIAFLSAGERAAFTPESVDGERRRVAVTPPSAQSMTSGRSA